MTDTGKSKSKSKSTGKFIFLAVLGGAAGAGVAIGYSLFYARQLFEIKRLNTERLKDDVKDEKYYSKSICFKQGAAGRG